MAASSIHPAAHRCPPAREEQRHGRTSNPDSQRVQRNQNKKAEKINFKVLNEKNKDVRRELEDELCSEEKTARAVRYKGAMFTVVATQRRWQARY